MQTQLACPHLDRRASRAPGPAGPLSTDRSCPLPLGFPCVEPEGMNRSRNSRKRRSAGRPARPFKSVASQMTPTHYQAVLDAADAELRGDAATALRRHRSVPMFARSNHGDRLELLAALGDEAPGWLISRWLTVQSRRRMWTGSRPQRVQSGAAPRHPGHLSPRRPVRADRVRVSGAGGGLRQRTRLGGAPGRRVRAAQPSSPWFVTTRPPSWCHEPTGSRTGAGRRWADTACEAGGAEAGALRLVDLAADEDLEVLDLGLAEHLEPGQHLLGRIVPTGAGPGRMFDWRPLPIDRVTATAVARNPPQWLPILATRAAAGRVPAGFSYLSDSSITADLPRSAWVNLLGRDGDVEPDDSTTSLPGPPSRGAAPGRVGSRRDLRSPTHGERADPRRRRHRAAQVAVRCSPVPGCLAHAGRDHRRSRWEPLPGDGPVVRRRFRWSGPARRVTPTCSSTITT